GEARGGWTPAAYVGPASARRVGRSPPGMTSVRVAGPWPVNPARMAYSSTAPGKVARQPPRTPYGGGISDEPGHRANASGEPRRVSAAEPRAPRAPGPVARLGRGRRGGGG